MMSSFTFGLEGNTGLVIWSMYTLFLLQQVTATQIQCSRRSLVTFFILLVIQQAVSLLHSPLLSAMVSMVTVMLHWASVPSSSLPVNKKAVLITGCDRGIGYALACSLDSQGYQVFAGCLDRDGKGAQDLARACSTNLQLLQMDVSNQEQVSQARSTVEKHLRSNDLWAVVNNAGICFIGNTEIISQGDIHRVFNVNLFGPLNVSREFLPLLRKSRGRLINVSSNTGLAPVAQMSIYCTSKSALATLSECMRYELQVWGMHVSTIVPSAYRTGILAYDKSAADDRWWREASQTVRDDFGRQCFTPEFKYENHEANTNSNLSSIVATVTRAISDKHPKAFYYSGFLSQALPMCYTYLPPFLREPVMGLIADWFHFKPNALFHDEENHKNNNKVKCKSR